MKNDSNFIIKDLFNRQRAGIKPGLERTLTLLNKLNNPHEKLKSIHIAGTNGKGTISSLLASYYKELNLKVGLYTSPHLVKFNERIRIGNTQISNQYLINKYNQLIDIINQIDATFFEITTVIAFSYFAENNCDICIIETGMGGRYDSTNVLNPILSIITSISFDHKEYLGNTLELIAAEKAGIIKQKTPVFLVNINDDILNVFQNEAKSKNAKLINLKNSESKFSEKIVKLISEENFKAKYQLNNIEFQTDLLGKHNTLNINSIANILKYISSEMNSKISNEFDEQKFISSIINLNKNTGYFGRMSIIKTNPYIILDTSHNEEALSYLIKIIKQHSNQKFNIIYTGMKDKENIQNLQIVKEITDKLILTKSSNPRNQELDILESNAKHLNYKEIETYQKLEECLDIELNTSNNILIVGSFFLISDVMKILKI